MPEGKIVRTAAVAALAAALCVAPAAAQKSTEELAKAAQNPVADMISLPFQNNTNFDYGPDDDVQNVLNIQPVWPFRIAPDWNLITRTILPVIYQPDLTLPLKVAPGVVEDVTVDGAFGLGDLNETLFFSPAKPSKVIWGAGPTFTLPTATDDVLGSGKWSAGPAFVVLTMPGRWVLGALVNNQWSFAGDSDRADVNAMLLQYFVNYNFEKGWYVTSAPINTANWEASSDDRWTIPIGGGVGRIFRAGKQPMNAQVSAYYNVVKPDTIPAADWQLRIQVQLLFPK
ncbi:MAG: neuromedin U [Acidobacteria bacterium]|jgi:hypothetical protein|nr:neuromedin U [Acidobacteriota bacterium]